MTERSCVSIRGTQCIITEAYRYYPSKQTCQARSWAKVGAGMPRFATFSLQLRQTRLELRQGWCVAVHECSSPKRLATPAGRATWNASTSRNAAYWGANLGRGDLWSLDFGLRWLAGLLERSSLLNSASTRSRQRTTLRTARDSRADSGRTPWA
jgi:hypothetical protein